MRRSGPPLTRSRLPVGGNVAARLLAAGYDVYGSARREQAARGLVRQGLRWTDTPREVGAAADVVLTSLPDDAAVEALAAGLMRKDIRLRSGDGRRPRLRGRDIAEMVEVLAREAAAGVSSSTAADRREGALQTGVRPDRGGSRGSSS